ncbi:MAG: hypothetical protein GX949_04760 [Peptococcaceae bacterium]|jgi:uncharacterized membrane protein|nr:hypothetical protein [Peptococcaceae bacterium]
MLKTVIGTFETREQAEKAVPALRNSGFYEDLSLVAADQKRPGSDQGMNYNSVASGVSTGGVLGGLAGLAMGVGALTIPGVGPIFAAGPIAGMLSGAATGGIAGGLVDWGIPAERSNFYEQKVKEGKILASVRSNEDKVDRAANILRENGAMDVEVH